MPFPLVACSHWFIKELFFALRLIRFVINYIYERTQFIHVNEWTKLNFLKSKFPFRTIVLKLKKSTTEDTNILYSIILMCCD